MRIISQDKNHSINFDNTYIWKQTTHIYAFVGKRDVVLGHYESEERAQEVFDEMHSPYQKVGGCLRGGLQMATGLLQSVCYCMPDK